MFRNLMLKPVDRFAGGDLAQKINKTDAAAAKGAVVHPESDKYEAPKEGGEDLP